MAKANIRVVDEAGVDHPIVEKFRKVYDQLVADARVSQQHTETEGWKALYAQHRDLMKKRRQELSDRMTGLAAGLVQIGVDVLKDLGECRKELADILVVEQQFDQSTIGPVKAPVDECREAITDAMTEAEELERKTPLVNQGIAQEMAAAVKSAPKVTWDPKDGVVRIVVDG